VLAKRGINIERQVLDTRGDFGYAIYEISQTCDESLIGELEQLPQTIRVRVTPGFR
jgi:D-3-phosphoglycerate dehydrogenase